MDQLGIAGHGSGYAVVEEAYGADRPGEVAIEAGRAGQFGRPVVLATTEYSARTQIAGPAIDDHGNVTAAWAGCVADGRGCSIGAVRGDVHGRFARPVVLAKTPLAGTRVRVQATPGAVAWNSCLADRCSVFASIADSHGRFGAARKLTNNGSLQFLIGNSHGDGMIVWKDASGSIWAATRRRGRRPVELATPRIERVSVDGRGAQRHLRAG